MAEGRGVGVGGEDVEEGQLNDWLWMSCDIYEFIAQYTSLEDIKDIEELAKYAEELDYREATTTLENAEEIEVVGTRLRKACGLQKDD